MPTSAGSRLVLALLVAAPLALAFSVDELVAGNRGSPALGVALAVVVSTLACLATGKGRALARGQVRRALVLNCSLVFALGAAELVLVHEAGRLGRTRFHRRLPNTHMVFTPDPDLYTGAPARARYTTSSLGVRGPELPATRGYRILCIGGSTTECVALDDSATWPALVMQSLGEQRVWVGNVGISGFSTWQHVRFVRESALLDEVDTVLVLCGINDLQGALSGEHASPAPLWRETEIARFVTALATRVDARWMSDVGVFDEHLSMLGRFREARRHGSVVDALPDLSWALAGYAARVMEIAALARKRSVVPVFATQPTLWSSKISQGARDRCWFGWLDEGRTRYLAGERFREALDRTNETLRRAARDAQAGCIELSSLDGREDLFEDECHFTEAGAREVAALVSKWLVEHGIPPR